MNNEEVREASRLQVPLSTCTPCSDAGHCCRQNRHDEMRIVQTIRMHKLFSDSQGQQVGRQKEIRFCGLQ